MCAEKEDHRKEEQERQKKMKPVDRMSIKDHLGRQNSMTQVEKQINQNWNLKDLQTILKSKGGTLAMIACYTVCMHTKCRCLSHELLC